MLIFRPIVYESAQTYELCVYHTSDEFGNGSQKMVCKITCFDSAAFDRVLRAIVTGFDLKQEQDNVVALRR